MPFSSEDLLSLALLRDTSVRLRASLAPLLDLELDPRVESSRRPEAEESLEVSRYKLESLVTEYRRQHSQLSEAIARTVHFEHEVGLSNYWLSHPRTVGNSRTRAS